MTALQDVQPPGSRSEPWERSFLVDATRQGGVALDFPNAVMDRLNAMERVYGARYLELGIERLLREIREEGLDLGGWPTITAQALYAEPMDDELRMHMQLRLQRIVSLGAQVELEVAMLLDLWRCK